MQKLSAGQIVGERYQLIRVIASGGVGVVWHAEHLALRSPVALKVLDPLFRQPEAPQRFLNEAWPAAALRSPHVVQILDCGVEDETPYIVMELLEGESLEERLARVSRLDAVETSRVVRHIARAIDRAHEFGIVHRDLKPGNIFIQTNDGDEIVKVLDFGVARTPHTPLDSSARGVTPAGVIVGTPHYMSPEQVSGSASVDFRTDIWALGIIAYQCLVGAPPRDGATIHDVLAAILGGTPVVPSQDSDVPHGFDDWFARACADNPADRYESGKQAAEQFSSLCGVSESVLSVVATSSAPLAVGLGAATTSPSSQPRAGHRRPDTALSLTGVAPLLRRSLPALLAVSSLLALWLLLQRRAESGAPATATRAQMPLASSPLEALRDQAREGPLQEPQSRSEPLAPAAGPSSPRLDLEGQKEQARPSEVARVPAQQPSPEKEPMKVKRRSARRSVTKAPGRERSSTPRSALDCTQAWFYDEHGLPRAKPECL